MLLLQNLLNPDYGMIKEDDESNLSWFRDSDDNSEITLRYINWHLRLDSQAKDILGAIKFCRKF